MDDKIENYLVKLERSLIDGDWKLFEFSKTWLQSFDTAAGVYVIREEGKICYVGETGSLRKRIKDLFDTRNHSLRRTIGNKRFLDVKGYEAGTASKKFPQEFEGELNQILEDNFEISTIVVKIGRKELEERLIEKYQPVYNSRGKRKSEEKPKTYSLDDKRAVHKNAYSPWTAEEEQQLMDLHHKGFKVKEISETLGRNEGAIQSRLKKLI